MATEGPLNSMHSHKISLNGMIPMGTVMVTIQQEIWLTIVQMKQVIHGKTQHLDALTTIQMVGRTTKINSRMIVRNGTTSTTMAMVTIQAALPQMLVLIPPEIQPVAGSTVV